MRQSPSSGGSLFCRGTLLSQDATSFSERPSSRGSLLHHALFQVFQTGSGRPAFIQSQLLVQWQLKLAALVQASQAGVCLKPFMDTDFTGLTGCCLFRTVGCIMLEVCAESPSWTQISLDSLDVASSGRWVHHV